MSPDELTTLAHSQVPSTVLLGLEVLSGRRRGVTAGVDRKPEFCTAGGMIHGGYLMAIANSIGALCVCLGLLDGATTSTVGSKTYFFRDRGRDRVQGDAGAHGQDHHRGSDRC